MAGFDPAKPRELSGVEIAFPASVTGTLMPFPRDLPPEFQPNKIMNNHGKWSALFSRLFYGPNPNAPHEDLKLVPKKGVDPQAAFRQIRAVMGSFEPKHEHKVGACCYMFSLWFDDYSWQPAEGDVGSVFFEL